MGSLSLKCVRPRWLMAGQRLKYFKEKTKARHFSTLKLALMTLVLNNRQQYNRFRKTENCDLIIVLWPEQAAARYLESHRAVDIVVCDCLCVFSSPLCFGAAAVQVASQHKSCGKTTSSASFLERPISLDVPLFFIQNNWFFFFYSFSHLHFFHLLISHLSVPSASQAFCSSSDVTPAR